MKKKLFSVFPKKLSNGTVMFYYTTYDENGKRKQFSTGRLTREGAYQECYKRLSEGKIVQRSKLIFSEFTKDWFIMEECPYYTVRQVKGRVYSRSSIENKRFTLFKHLIPSFGDLKLDHITTQNIELWLKNKVAEGYAVNTINLYLSLLSIILQEAVRLGYIERNPCSAVIKFSGKKKRRVSCLEMKFILFLIWRIKVEFGILKFSF